MEFSRQVGNSSSPEFSVNKLSFAFIFPGSAESEIFPRSLECAMKF